MASAKRAEANDKRVKQDKKQETRRGRVLRPVGHDAEALDGPAGPFLLLAEDQAEPARSQRRLHFHFVGVGLGCSSGSSSSSNRGMCTAKRNQTRGGSGCKSRLRYGSGDGCVVKTGYGSYVARVD